MRMPLFLFDVFSHIQASRLSGGGSGASLYLLDTEQGTFVLKQQANTHPFHSLRHEREACQWLQGKLPVPLVRAFAEESGFEFLCVSRLPGRDLLAALAEGPAGLWVTRYADTLRRLHAVPLEGAVPYRSLDAYLDAARHNMENGLVDVQDLNDENRGCSLQDLYDQLLSLRPAADIGPVFIHGDYYPENIIFDGDGLSGLIDLGRGGIGDRYHDLALAIRFIRDNIDPAFVGLFLQEYGLSDIDPARLAFYELLDEFF